MRPILVRPDMRAALASIAGVLGLIDLVASVAAPRQAPPLYWPLAPAGGPLAVLACACALLLLVRGLRRGLRVAWMAALIVLLHVVLAAPLGHDEWALVGVALAVLLALRRADFSARVRAPRRGTAVALAGVALLLAGGSSIRAHHLGHARGASFAPVARAADVDADNRRAALLLHRVTPPVHPRSRSPFPLPLGGLGAAAVLLGLGTLTLPARPRSGDGGRRTARRLFDAHGANGVGYFAPMPDKAVWSDLKGRGAVGFRVIGGTALVVGDPIAAAADLPAVLDGFLAHCRANGWTPAFYQTLGATVALYRARGCKALAIGQEALVDLPSFTLQGKRIANVRHSVTHAERAGYTVRVYATGEPDAAARAAIADVSREWLAGKGGEMGFTMGQLSPEGQPSPGARVAVAYDADGRAQAFLTVVPLGAGRGWMLDLMRRRADAVSGAMDLLIARTAEALRDEGYAVLSLSLAPLASGEGDDEDAPSVARWARGQLYARMRGAYNYRSLYSYKKKFGVRWETRYLVYAGDAALPAALFAVTRAHMPAHLIAVPSLSRVAVAPWRGLQRLVERGSAA